ncbi:hypothetical protein HWV62_12954 [Athelia sp. TMB]|nr:hypothetical protein HWV62_12954 [Athelia sp. TMB]
MADLSNARSPLSAVFLLHLALELPVAIQGLWMPSMLPFLEMNNTTLIILKVRVANTLSLSACLTPCRTIPALCSTYTRNLCYLLLVLLSPRVPPGKTWPCHRAVCLPQCPVDCADPSATLHSPLLRNPSRGVSLHSIISRR